MFGAYVDDLYVGLLLYFVELLWCDVVSFLWVVAGGDVG